MLAPPSPLAADSAALANRPDDVPASPDCARAAGPSPIAGGCATDLSTTATWVRDTGAAPVAPLLCERCCCARRQPLQSRAVGAAELAGPYAASPT